MAYKKVQRLNWLRLPKIWVLCQLPLEGLVPLVQYVERDPANVRLGCHLGLRDGKRRGEVVQILQHFGGELRQAAHVRGLRKLQASE